MSSATGGPRPSKVGRRLDPAQIPGLGSELVMKWMNLDDLWLKTVSYAQNHEDVLLARAFPASTGFYLDVGANHPIFHSVTKLFSRQGWTGINVEPSPLLFETLRADRPRDINLNVGVGDRAATLTFHETPAEHGWSTFRSDLADHYLELGVDVVARPIPVQTLAEICATHVGQRTIDFLKVDAEGFEHQVLLGADFERWRPRVVVVENAAPALWEPLLLAAHYLPAAFDGVNRFYVRAEEPALLEPFATPINVHDNVVPFEYLRLALYLNHDAARKFSFVNAIRHDAPRLVRKIRHLAGKLRGRRAAPPTDADLIDESSVLIFEGFQHDDRPLPEMPDPARLLRSDGPDRPARRVHRVERDQLPGREPLGLSDRDA